MPPHCSAVAGVPLRAALLSDAASRRRPYHRLHLQQLRSYGHGNVRLDAQPGGGSPPAWPPRWRLGCLAACCKAAARCLTDCLAVCCAVSAAGPSLPLVVICRLPLARFRRWGQAHPACSESDAEVPSCLLAALLTSPVHQLAEPSQILNPTRPCLGCRHLQRLNRLNPTGVPELHLVLPRG